MKKLLTMLAAIVVATISQAATVNWLVLNVQSSSDTAVAAGWAIQVFSSTVTYDYAKAAAGEITPWETGATVLSGTSYRATGSGTQANGTSASYYAVIYDAASIDSAKNYIVSAAVAVMTNDAGSDARLSFGNMSGTGTTNAFLNSSWTATAAVPEPTSGMLILLGMAGLALRRRRA